MRPLEVRPRQERYDIPLHSRCQAWHVSTDTRQTMELTDPRPTLHLAPLLARFLMELGVARRRAAVARAFMVVEILATAVMTTKVGTFWAQLCGGGS